MVNLTKGLKEVPREAIFNRTLLLSALVYAFTGVPPVWDQGSSSVLPSLPGFEKHFHISSGANPNEIQNFVSIVYIGYAVGSILSFFVNDRIGRRWSLRAYLVLWIIGQMIAISAPNIAGLYAARIVQGMGIGALGVVGPMALVEISPAEIRGILTAWYVIAQGLGLVVSIFCVYGTYNNMAATLLQYQVIWFSPAIAAGAIFVCSFYISESPRWLMLVDKHEEAAQTLAKLRGMHINHPRVRGELDSISRSVEQAHAGGKMSLVHLARETFMVSSNLRRLVITLIAYAFAQLSGANSITSYFVPIMNMIGEGGNTSRTIFLSGMYAFTKFWCVCIATFLLIDVLGRRRSLFIGATVQMITHIYIGVFIKYNQEGKASYGAAQGAIAAVFIHAFGYSIGLYILPYVFGSEMWPNHIRSFGGAVSSAFHWLFIFAMKYAFPKMLSAMDNWGTFIFFAGCCFLALCYGYFMVPEVAGLSVEELDIIFQGGWFSSFNARKKISKHLVVMKGEDLTPKDEEERLDTKVTTIDHVEGSSSHRN